MATYALMGNDISNAAGDGPPNFPFGIKLSTATVKDLLNSSYVITDSDSVGLVTSSTALTSNQTVTLPSAINNISRQIRIKKSDSSSFAIQVVIPGGDTLDGFTTAFNISAIGGAIIVVASAAGKWLIAAGANITPTRQEFRAAGAATYTTPSYVRRLRIQMVGGGGGGAGGGNSQTGGMSVGGVGLDTTFGGSSFLIARGGAGGVWNGQPVNGPTATIGAGAIGVTMSGGMTTAGTQMIGNTQYQNGANGASSFFGGHGSGSYANTNGNAAMANSGSGGGGGGTGNVGSGNNVGGGGGASGAYLSAIVANPAPSYAVVVGAGGGGGTPGTTGGFSGGAGGSGYVEVIEEFV